MAELKCKDGTIIKISDETEQELRKAFGEQPKPDYKDAALRVYIIEGEARPIAIRIAKDCTGGIDFIMRDTKDIETFIVALQKVVAYCKQHNLGM